ncbi:MAG: sigma 54-interacting transcriptional regulator [Deltaproteobacteria bacterium]|nr:sigma 54-interacting transcriptional regulator [Deltaproteobacteria bacterium]
MPSYSIPNPQILKQEIAASHERCHNLGVNPKDRRNPHQKRLTPGKLKERLEQNRDFLDIATNQIGELYQFVAGAGFAVNIADKEGYILHIIGDKPILAKLADGNCCPGFRWTEKDVGTSVLSLALERKIPVQINDDEHFCRRGHGHTCSASPVFGLNHELIGVISMSGDAERVHPHTLGMVITAARAIENQLRIQKNSKELRLQNNYMLAIIDSIDSGVLAIDKNGIINKINNQGKKILKWKAPLEGIALFEVFGNQFSIDAMMQPEFELIDQEVFIHTNDRVIQILCTVKPIFDATGKIQGSIIVFNEIKRIRKLLNDMAGAQARFTFEDIIGASPSIQEAKRLAMIAAKSSSSVLLLGDTGTGKELFAHAVHNYSTRKERPFLVINCGAIPRELLESELFGYVEGSFTGSRKGGRPGKFELADGGTVFLDEIGEMPADMQVKLLRVLQTGEVCRIGEHKSLSVDVRIIAATNARIKQEIDQKNFREDLFYRLNVFPIKIPPLRGRKEDIVHLARHFLERSSNIAKKQGVKLTPEAESKLINYQWPGNVRELENIVERAVNMVDGKDIGPGILDISSGSSGNLVAGNTPGSRLEELEKQAILKILEELKFNMSRSAQTLGISRATLYNKIKKYNLTVSRVSV